MGIPVINQTLFFLSMLFGLNMSMFGEQAVVDIDLEDKTGSITFKHLVTSQEYAPQAKAALRKFHDEATINKRFDFMQLVEEKITVNQDELQVKVNLTYENEQQLLEGLGIFKNEEGNLVYKILERETFLATNGEQQDGLVKWPAEVSGIHLEIAGAILEEQEKETSVSLGENNAKMQFSG